MTPPRRRLAAMAPKRPSQTTQSHHMTVTSADKEEMRRWQAVADDPRYLDSDRAQARKRAQAALRRIMNRP